MVTDGLHARTDGLTSLAVLVAALGTAIGLPILDPLIGIVIGIAIVFITRDATKAIWYRLMDAVDPALIDSAEALIKEHDEVKKIPRLQMRWLGHRLYAEIVVELDQSLSLVESEKITDHIHHHLMHTLPQLTEATISAVPYDGQKRVYGLETLHHREQMQTAETPRLK
jgi:cation diffusion facilitator family transporter